MLCLWVSQRRESFSHNVPCFAFPHSPKNPKFHFKMLSWPLNVRSFPLLPRFSLSLLSLSPVRDCRTAGGDLKFTTTIAPHEVLSSFFSSPHFFNFHFTDFCNLFVYTFPCKHTYTHTNIGWENYICPHRLTPSNGLMRSIDLFDLSTLWQKFDLVLFYFFIFLIYHFQDLVCFISLSFVVGGWVDYKLRLGTLHNKLSCSYS